MKTRPSKSTNGAVSRGLTQLLISRDNLADPGAVARAGERHGR